MQEPTSSDLLVMTADLVSAFVGNNTVRAAEVPELIATIHASLTGIASPKGVEEPVPELKPAVSIRKSVSDEFLICLDDGKKFRSLKRHLATLGMTPAEYRAKWGLSADYPMVAPGYAAKRSELAKASGLGSARRKVIAPPAAPAATEPMPVAEGAKRRGRPAKKAA